MTWQAMTWQVMTWHVTSKIDDVVRTMMRIRIINLMFSKLKPPDLGGPRFETSDLGGPRFETSDLGGPRLAVRDITKHGARVRVLLKCDVARAFSL